MNIGETAKRAGLPAKTIRYYESIGLVYPPRRGSNGYRRYDQETVHILQFIRRARGLGFSVEECRNLLSLYRDKNRASAEVKRLTKQRVADIDTKIAELTAMRTTLTQLIERCQGGQRPDCPILEGLSQPQPRY
ncbi:Cu(I)-responsive transcriptional regulator [Nitrosococcus watsonii]|uniref:Transcriptional regulator, MerR family n=1 Tax=Nitrosococcus watsoni (strain C-113) TaxID=105559 RepID=D8KBL1_NITWC|nr:Cu(I)-responsive transcriptional regulator [Nitrosococcus watsonii]ADJ29658.1 transcriptional regulator, MerR family [Nitrosococcus watsonii C-113]